MSAAAAAYEAAVARLKAAAAELGDGAEFDERIIRPDDGQPFHSASLRVSVPEEKAGELCAWLAPLAVETDAALHGFPRTGRFLARLHATLYIEVAS